MEKLGVTYPQYLVLMVLVEELEQVGVTMEERLISYLKVSGNLLSSSTINNIRQTKRS